MSAQAVAANPLRILLVEDSTTQVVLTQRAANASSRVEITDIARDGEEAIEFLRRKGNYENAERPDLILLDLNMPKKDGLQVLEEIKGDKGLQTIPVILFTTSECAEDVSKSYAYGASTFITKPTRIDELREVLDDIGRYWSHAKLPGTEQAEHAA
jgi:chemotaxis family two-component system response regulator Rcp1